MANDFKQPRLVDFPQLGDNTIGYLTTAENSMLPFTIQRVYWTYLVSDEVVRGHHAHRELKQLIFAVAGTIKLTLEDVNGQQTTFRLDQPNTDLYISRLYWNDLRPRSGNKNYQLSPNIIKEGASIGANATILADISIGRYAMTGIGAVVTRNVKDYPLIYSNPARHHGWVDETGEKLLAAGESCWRLADGKRSYRETASGLVPDDK